MTGSDGNEQLRRHGERVEIEEPRPQVPPRLGDRDETEREVGDRHQQVEEEVAPGDRDPRHQGQRDSLAGAIDDDRHRFAALEADGDQVVVGLDPNRLSGDLEQPVATPEPGALRRIAGHELAQAHAGRGVAQRETDATAVRRVGVGRLEVEQTGEQQHRRR